MQQLDEAEFGKLKLCFSPESAAIIGASTDPMKFGGRALKFCLERGYAGRLYRVVANGMCAESIEDGGALMTLWENIVDTILNVAVIVFIGLLIWLYLKKKPDSHATDEEKKPRQS